MRAAVFGALILMVATPSEASESCRSRTEARRHFGLVHIYWHGPNRCWDASSGRQQRRITHTAVAKPDQRKWRDAMSEMVPDAQVASEVASVAQVAQIPWLDRWVDMKQSEPSLIARGVDVPQAAPPPAAEPTTTSHSEGTSFSVLLIFALLVVALPLAIIVLPQGVIYRRQLE
jgi:hypothetical protein